MNCINLILISDSANARDFLSDGDVYFSIISNINIKILKAIILDTKRGTQKSYSLILFRLSLTRDFLSMFVLSVLKTELLCLKIGKKLVSGFQLECILNILFLLMVGSM